jgi:hypothetical protein
VADDPILQTKSVAAFMGALNQTRHTDFPTDFPAASLMSDVWSTPIQVQSGNGEGNTYTATGELKFAPFNFSQNAETPFRATLKITIRDLPPQT